MMKKYFLFTILAITLLVGSNAYAQAQGQRPRAYENDWSSRMKSEKIGFLTSEIGLTPQEAQEFWPIYNRAEEEKSAAMQQVISSFGEMMKALDEGKGDFSKLINTYLEANSAQGEIDKKYVKEYCKVLSAEKVAKLFTAEEKFRREQIRKLNHRNGFGPIQPIK